MLQTNVDLLKDFPHGQLLIMALLDAISFSGLVLSAAAVTPTMTLILLHASTPCVVWGSICIFPQRIYSDIQNRGTILIAVAVVVSLSEAVIDSHSAWDHFVASSFVYCGSAIVQGISSLYKEKCIISFARPVDTHYMSAWLFLYQFMITLLLSPFIFYMQGWL
jgi:hypothetical protein